MANTPLDVVDRPRVGDEVLYRRGTTGAWTAATVLAVAAHDGDLKLDTGEGEELAALDVKRGTDPHNWQPYPAAARG